MSCTPYAQCMTQNHVNKLWPLYFVHALWSLTFTPVHPTLALPAPGIPATAIYLNTYDFAKKAMLEQQSTMSPFLVFLTAGMAAETLACLVFVPVDVMKERMQVQGLPGSSSTKGGVYYKNTFDAVRQIAKSEGLIRGFYKGYSATLLSFGPFSAIYFALYEGLKPLAARLMNPTAATAAAGAGAADVPADSFGSNLLASAVAGAAASWITNPLDLAKLRLQIARMADAKVATGPAAGLNLHSTRGMLTYVHRKEGLRGLYRGALARVYFHAPHTAVTMVAYEEFKRLLS